MKDFFFIILNLRISRDFYRLTYKVNYSILQHCISLDFQNAVLPITTACDWRLTEVEACSSHWAVSPTLFRCIVYLYYIFSVCVLCLFVIFCVVSTFTFCIFFVFYAQMWHVLYLYSVCRRVSTFVPLLGSVGPPFPHSGQPQSHVYYYDRLFDSSLSKTLSPHWCRSGLIKSVMDAIKKKMQAMKVKTGVSLKPFFAITHCGQISL